MQLFLRKASVFGLAMITTAILGAQQPLSRDGGGPDRHENRPPPGQSGRPPMDQLLHVGPGRWWNDGETAQRLGLTDDQRKRMDTAFQQSRLKLIDLSAQLQKEEALLDPLLEADRPDGSKVIAQLDRVAETRAELEKASGRLLFNLRIILNPDQWRKLQTFRSGPPRGGPGGEHSGPPRFPDDHGRGPGDLDN